MRGESDDDVRPLVHSHQPRARRVVSVAAMMCSTCGLTASTALETRLGVVFVAHTQKLTHPRRVVEWVMCSECERKERRHAR